MKHKVYLGLFVACLLNFWLRTLKYDTAVLLISHYLHTDQSWVHDLTLLCIYFIRLQECWMHRFWDGNEEAAMVWQSRNFSRDVRPLAASIKCRKLRYQTSDVLVTLARSATYSTTLSNQRNQVKFRQFFWHMFTTMSNWVLLSLCDIKMRHARDYRSLGLQLL